MVAIPQGPHVRWFCIVTAGLLLAACQRDGGASTQTQRRIGEARMQDDLFVSLTYGAVRGFTEDQLVLRSASPLVEITLEAGANAFGPIDVELRNQHLDASLRVVTATVLDADDLDGCPVVTGIEINCVAAFDAVGAACETSGQCPAGLRCASETCQPGEAFDLCAPPDVQRLQGQRTSMQFDHAVESCTRLRLETFVEPTDEPLRFAVLGPTRDEEVIAALSDDFEAARLDFVVLLGDHVSSRSEAGLAALERIVTLLGTPTVVLAGPREISSDQGAPFLRRFGPHDHIWRLKGAGFFAFFSATGGLGNRGLDRLDGFLRLLDDDPEAPLIGFTHVPPFDPNDLRDNAFRSDIEATQVMSLLEQHGVHQIYAGGLGTGYEQTLGVETFVTTGRGTTTQPSAEWILVEISPDGEGREVGDRVISSERRDL